MGFRAGAYCTVWGVEPKSDTMTSVRLSISRMDKNTGKYVTDFSGFTTFTGTVAATKAVALQEKDRIKLGDVDVSSKWDEEKKVMYYNFKVFSFEMANNSDNKDREAQPNSPQPQVDGGVIDDSRLPF